MSLADLTLALMAVPGLSGHERRVRAAIRERLGEGARSDSLGNLWTTRPGEGPVVMLFAHMDQIGFVVRRVEEGGFLRLERVGGVPERALPGQAALVAPEGAPDVPGIIAAKSHHATRPDEKYAVTPYRDLFVDCGFESRAGAEAAGIRIGTPIVYAPSGARLGPHRLAGAAIDDRAGCAVLIEVAEALREAEGTTVHAAFTVQEEFNLRGALPLARRLRPDIAIQIDLMLASDSPGTEDAGEMRLGGGPGISLMSFHGRGTLNGVIPHPALARLFEEAAASRGIPLQRSAQSGILTDLSYVQLAGEGAAALDVGFPMRYSHSSREMADLRDLERLRDLLLAALEGIGPGFPLERDP